VSERLWTLKAAAERLTISRRSLERLIASGRIRVIHPSPGRSAITDSELEAYVAALVRAA
jgi:excisionase family DNA binding protein